MIERFSMVLSNRSRPELNGSLLEKAVNRIYQAALLHRVAVIKTHRNPARSVIVVDADDEKDWLDDVLELTPERLVGIYSLAGSTHRALIEALQDDLAAAGREMEPTS